MTAPAVVAVDALLWDGVDADVLAIQGSRRARAPRLLRASIVRVVIDRLCNPERTARPPWWSSLLQLPGRLARLAGEAPSP